MGVPCCALLSLMRRLLEVLPRKRRGNRPGRILFVLITETGGLVVSHPAVEHARRTFPNAELYFLCSRAGRSILSALGTIEEQRLLDIRTDGFRAFITDAVRTVWRLRRLKIEATIDLEIFLRFSGILAFLSGARSRVGYHRFCNEGNYAGDLLTHKLIHNPHLHVAQAYLSLVEALTGEPDTEPQAKVAPAALPIELPCLRPKAADRDAVLSMIRGLFPAFEMGKPIVLVNPNASDRAPVRRWPLSSFRDLIAGLLELPGTLVILTGDASERVAVERLRLELRCERVLNLAGRTTIEQLLALYHLSRLLVTNDSGPAHFASLTRLPALVLFGPETPRAYAPLGPMILPIYRGLACSPCLSVYNKKRSPCRANRCLTSITPGEVLTLARSLLAAGSAGASGSRGQVLAHGGGDAVFPSREENPRACS